MNQNYKNKTPTKTIPKGIKWEHYRELMKYSKISKHLPFTMKLNKQSLFDMLSRYKTVYLKPNIGAYGIGVMRIQELKQEKRTYYHVQLGIVRKRLQSKEELYSFILRNRVKDDYLVQQGIELLRWKKRPFDLRLMISKQNDGIWRNEGFVGRAAHPQKIVTNIRSGGTAVSIEELLSSYTNDTGRRKIIQKLNRLGCSICLRLENKYPGIRLFGVDAGLDRNLNPWIIEVNTRPEKICWKCLRKLLRKNKKDKCCF